MAPEFAHSVFLLGSRTSASYKMGHPSCRPRGSHTDGHGRRPVGMSLCSEGHPSPCAFSLIEAIPLGQRRQEHLHFPNTTALPSQTASWR